MRTAVLVMMSWLAVWPAAMAQSGGTGPRAKTGAEYDDYNAAYATKGGAAMETAADNFASKYPSSELKVYLFSKAMHDYQNENNGPKMLSMGEKVLALEPHNTIALVLTATVLADSLSDNDTDRNQKIAEIRSNAENASRFVDEFTPPPNVTPEQIAAYRSTVQSMARGALGIMELKTGDDAGAEADLRQAASLNVAPDPYIWYHLALAQDHQKKYSEALASVNEALKYTSGNAELDKLARGEQARLAKLAESRPTVK